MQFDYLPIPGASCFRPVIIGISSRRTVVFINASGWMENVDPVKLIEAGQRQVASGGVIGILYNKPNTQGFTYAIYSDTGHLESETEKDELEEIDTTDCINSLLGRYPKCDE